jgi:sec-independent protein translocase protein TatA
MDPLIAFSTPGWPEILFILLIILVLFGAKRLPELARGLGQSLNEFRKAREELDREVKKTAETIKATEAPGKEPHNPA